MLQIVGWLGCLYLLVKALEIISSSGHRDERGDVKPGAVFAAGLSILGSGGFAYAIYAHGTSAEKLAMPITTIDQPIGVTPEELGMAPSSTDEDAGVTLPELEMERSDCRAKATTAAERLACK